MDHFNLFARGVLLGRLAVEASDRGYNDVTVLRFVRRYCPQLLGSREAITQVLAQ